jgi:hypothetical protein
MSPGFGWGFLRFMGDFRGCFGKSGRGRAVFCSQLVVKRMVKVDGGLSFGAGRKISTNFGFIFESVG